jgi:hypothetical protein
MSAVQRQTEGRIKRLKNVVNDIRSLPSGSSLSRMHLTRLMLAWGNLGYSANIRYLQQIERLFRTGDGAVLECGSGATTLLMGLLAEKEDRYVWSFENHEGWSRQVRAVLQAFNLNRVTVCHTPLRDYGAYDWYELPSLPLPRDFDLVICDGPPGKIPGGRYGLMPVMGSYLCNDCRILLDDTHRSKEKALIHRWADEHRLTWSRLGKTGRCAEIAFA